MSAGPVLHTRPGHRGEIRRSSYWTEVRGCRWHVDHDHGVWTAVPADVFDIRCHVGLSRREIVAKLAADTSLPNVLTPAEISRRYAAGIPFWTEAPK